MSSSITPGQAQYVLARLLADRRISATEVAAYVREIPSEIAAVQKRIAELRGTSPSASSPSAERTPAPARRNTKQKPRRTHSAAGKLGLRFSGLLRHLPAKIKGELKALRMQKGIEAAIEAAVAANHK